jgi:hypothetical protein
MISSIITSDALVEHMIPLSRMTPKNVLFEVVLVATSQTLSDAHI